MDKSKYDVFIGKILDSRYKILELVGVGGMAFVLKATDLVMNRIVAIKILNEDLNGDEQAEQRFINESKAVAMLSHKNIVNIYDVAIYADMKYIVMEFLDGITLKEYLTRKEKLDWKEASFYICQILRALDHAHTKGIVHRDIKPQNILLLRTGEIKVTDFGIAKVPNTEPLTMTDKALGTVYYISPEQASGRPTGYYSDLYSVGVMLYETVTGILPFVATSPVTVAMMQVSDVPKSPSEHVPELPGAIVSVILKAMEKQPESRFRSAHSMARVIEEIVLNPDYEFKVDEEFDDYNNTGINAINQVKPDASEFQSQADKEYAEAQRKIAQKLSDTDVNIKKKKKGKKESGAFSGGGLLPIAAALTFAFILALVGAGVAVGYQVFSHIFTVEEQTVSVEIPNLVEKIWDEGLEKELLAKKIKVRVQYDNSDNEERNIILKQNPAGGVKRNLTSNMEFVEIYLNLSVGKKEVVVPDMTITEYREAKTKLELLGLRVIEYEQFHPTVLPGYVISTSPSVGNKLKNGDTINIYTSKGQEVKQVSVPLLDGKTEDEAKKLLKDHRLLAGEVDIVITADESKDGLVTLQSISAGTMVNEYSTAVSFSVFKYEEPEQPIEESGEESEIIIEP